MTLRDDSILVQPPPRSWYHAEVAQDFWPKFPVILEHEHTTHDSSFTIGGIGPTTRPGTYDVFISVGARDGTPRIALPLTGDDGQRRYQLGTVTLQNPAAKPPGKE